MANYFGERVYWVNIPVSHICPLKHVRGGTPSGRCSPVKEASCNRSLLPAFRYFTDVSRFRVNFSLFLVPFNLVLLMSILIETVVDNGVVDFGHYLQRV